LPLLLLYLAIADLDLRRGVGLHCLRCPFWVRQDLHFYGVLAIQFWFLNLKRTGIVAKQGGSKHWRVIEGGGPDKCPALLRRLLRFHCQSDLFNCRERLGKLLRKHHGQGERVAVELSATVEQVGVEAVPV